MKNYLDEYKDLNQEIHSILTEVMNSQYDLSVSESYNIECRRRDGFIPYSSNHGGVRIDAYNSLMGIVGSGMFPRHKDAALKIQKFYDQSIEYAWDEFLESNITNYDQLPEDLRDELYNLENEYTSSENDQVMFYLQVKYEGLDSNNKHVFYITSGINLEAPYFRVKSGLDFDNSLEVKFKDINNITKALPKILDKLIDQTF